MRLEHLYATDLSLLVVLQVLLEERSVTRAARRLGRSQPAVSRALGRLRDLLGDPLFVRDGATLAPTPRAEALAVPLQVALSALDARVLRARTFDPATDRRSLEILAADFAEATLLPRPLARLAREAPHVDVVLTVSRVGRSMADALREGVHLVVSPIAGADASIRSVFVGVEDFACLLRRGHPAADALDLDTYVSLSHVLVAPGGTPGGVVDRALEARGLSRRVAVRTRHFLPAPELVAHTDHVLTLPRRFAEFMARRLDLVVTAPPLPLPSFDMRVGWHETWQHDPGHRYLRELVIDEVRAQLSDSRQ